MRLLKLAPALFVCLPIVAIAGDGSSVAPNDEVMLGDPSLTAGIPGIGLLTEDELFPRLDDPANHVPLKVKLPKGL